MSRSLRRGNRLREHGTKCPSSIGRWQKCALRLGPALAPALCDLMCPPDCGVTSADPRSRVYNGRNGFLEALRTTLQRWMAMLFPFDKRRTQESEDYHFIQSMDHLGGLALRARTFLLHGAAVRDNNFIILACSHISRLEEQASQWKLPEANPDREWMKQGTLFLVLSLDTGWSSCSGHPVPIPAASACLFPNWVVSSKNSLPSFDHSFC